MKLTIARLRWSWRAWPIIVPIALGATHLLLIFAFDTPLIVSKIISAALQATGGGLVVYSINQNMGMFKNHGLMMAFRNYCKEWPSGKSRSVTIELTPASFKFGGSAIVAFGRGPTTMEERLVELEKQIKECRELVYDREKALNVQIDAAKAEFRKTAREQRDEIKNLSNKFENSVVGGIKLQVFGVLLVIHGAIISIFV